MKVSRSPVRRALRLLADDGIVAPAECGGYTIARTGPALAETSPLQVADDNAEDAYLRIAADRLDGRLPTGSPRARPRPALRPDARTARPHLAPDRRRGMDRPASRYGWELQPMLTSMETYQDGYRFRLTVEPAAVLESGFVLETVRAQQQRWSTERCTPSATPSYDLNSRFHEVVMACSRTSSFIDSLHRVDPSTGAHSNATAPFRRIEHVRLADLLLTGKRGEASDYLREHLSSSSQEKTNRSGH